MKIILWILIVAAAILVLLLIIALFTKKTFATERSIVINKTKNEVFNYIKFLKNQDNFSKWARIDSNMKREFRGVDGTQGFVSAWDSEDKKVGKGEQEIVKITDHERIDYVIRFIIPFESIANSYMTTDSISVNQTKVTWGFRSEMKYPMNLMLLFMNMESMIGNDFDTGLNNLKAILEK